MGLSRYADSPDPPSRHHLPFDRPFDKPFDKLTVLSKVEGLTALSKVDPSTKLRVDAEQSRSIEGLMALSKAEGRRCLRSFLSFDLEALDRLAAYCSIRLSRRSSAPCI